jgi:hypothetical protein
MPPIKTPSPTRDRIAPVGRRRSTPRRQRIRTAASGKWFTTGIYDRRRHFAGQLFPRIDAPPQRDRYFSSASVPNLVTHKEGNPFPCASRRAGQSPSCASCGSPTNMTPPTASPADNGRPLASCSDGSEAASWARPGHLMPMPEGWLCPGLDPGRSESAIGETVSCRTPPYSLPPATIVPAHPLTLQGTKEDRR